MKERNNILSKFYFVELLSLNCMYMCWVVSLVPLPLILRVTRYIESLLFVPLVITGLVTWIFDKDKWFTGKFTKNYNASEKWKELYPRTYRLEQLTIFLVRNSWKYFLLVFLLYCILYGSGVLK
jgi:hypothetical protein